MKKTYLISLSFLLIFSIKASYSQDKQNVIYAGWAPGAFSYQSFYEGTFDVITDIIGGFGYDENKDNTVSTGIISIGYNRFLSEKAKLGFSASYLKFTNTREYYKSGELKESYKWSDSFITLMLRFDFHYLRREKISLYSGVSAGISLVQGNNISGAENLTLPDESLFAFHLNVFGIRFGKDLGFFLESGFGYNGLISGGINYQF